MADEEQLLESQEEPAQDRSTYALFAMVGLVAVVVVLVLLFLQQCSSDPAGEDTSAGGTIEAVEGLNPADTAVSVWVRPESSIGEVLGRNGLSSAAYDDLGEGTYVIEIGDRDPDEVVEMLAADPGLYDAGYVFEDE